MKKEIFYEKMRGLLGDEAEEFFNSLERPLTKGIRVNTLKLDKDKFLELVPFKTSQVKWCNEGMYLEEAEDRPGKHPYYYSGIYYLQEPSAMLPVEALDVKPGDKVLDISAAPGGKSTQIGAKLNNKGLLVSNDISPKRTIALAKNISLFGIKNAIVTNQTPAKLSDVFEGFFDKILVDAPCSGEGLLKKDFKNYEPDNEKYVKMQKEILSSIPHMLKGGGTLVYSTCTFSPEENEGIIKWFIEENPEFEVANIDIDKLSNGKPEWVDGDGELRKVKRAWPHKLHGEGHFIAKLVKKIDTPNVRHNSFRVSSVGSELYLEFANEYGLNDNYKKNIHVNRDEVYIIPEALPDIMGLKTVSLGLNVGEIKNKKFIPSTELALTLTEDSFSNSVNLSKEDINVIKYLKGETLDIEAPKGWVLVCVDGFGLGFAKSDGSSLKNFYKKQWRMM